MSGKRGVQEAKAHRNATPNEDDGLKVPDHLLKSIMEGNCIAFVGAGFSGAAGLPGWGKLLEAILDRGVEKNVQAIVDAKEEIQDMLKAGRFEQVAQILEDEMDPTMFSDVLSEKLLPPSELPDAMKERLVMLHGIPFAAIVTTNFDYFLPGVPAAHKEAKPMMRKILRSSPLTLIEQVVRQFKIIGQFMKEVANDDDLEKQMDAVIESIEDTGPPEDYDDDEAGSDCSDDSSVDMDRFFEHTPCIQLHGTAIHKNHEDAREAIEQYSFNDKVNSLYDDYDFRADPGLAFTQKGYRNLLYGNTAYRKFLAGIMATKTILYIGFSFSDAYINEMRSETLMMMQKQEDDDEDEIELRTRPIAYAIVSNRPDSETKLYKKHEGVEFLNYKTEDPKDPGFEGVEKWLTAIHMQTNPLYRWAKCLAGRKVLVFATGVYQAFPRILSFVCSKVFKGGHGDFGEFIFLDPPKDGDCPDAETINHMFQEAAGDNCDLIIAGFKCNGHPTGQIVLEAMQKRDFDKRIPVLITDAAKPPKTNPGIFYDNRKRTVQRMGATAYVCNIPSVFRQLSLIFAKPAAPTDQEKSLCPIS